MSHLLKPCTKCKKELPGNADHFYRDASNSEGLHPWCKTCKDKIRAAYVKTPHGKAKKQQHVRGNTDKIKLYPQALSIAVALMEGRTESAHRLAKTAYLAAQKAGLL